MTVLPLLAQIGPDSLYTAAPSDSLIAAWALGILVLVAVMLTWRWRLMQRKQNIPPRVQPEQRTTTPVPTQKPGIHTPTREPQTTEPITEQPTETKWIGYVPADVPPAPTPPVYPIVSWPKANSVVKYARGGRTGNVGVVEKDFATIIEQLLGKDFGIYVDRQLPTGTGSRPFEPDLALVHTDDALRLLIDIELDEPYGGVSREPTHYLLPDGTHSDAPRDSAFSARGWVVVRFSEQQAHEDPAGCCRLVADVVRLLAPSYALPIGLANVSPVKVAPCWTEDEARQWAADNVRERYLGIEGFGLTESEEIEPVEDQTEEEVAAEDEVKQPDTLHTAEEAGGKTPLVSEPPATYPVGGGTTVRSADSGVVETPGSPSPIAEIHAHPRDAHILFKEQGHVYTVQGQPYRSVTDLVHSFFPVFDGAAVAATLVRDGKTADPLNKYYEMTAGKIEARFKAGNEETQTLGTALHRDIEDRLNGRSPSSKTPEYGYFERFLTDSPGLKPYRSEWRVYDEAFQIAGTVNAVFCDAAGAFHIYGWTRSKQINRTNNFVNGRAPLDHIPHANYWHKALQLNLYSWILNQRYDLSIKELHFLVLHPNNESFVRYSVPTLDGVVKAILNVHLRALRARSG